MGQTNSRRVSHKLEDAPNTFRDDQLKQILDDIDEAISGKGYCEIAYLSSTPFVDTITVYRDSGKTLKRAMVTYEYIGDNPPFVETVTTQIFDEETGLTVVVTVTDNISYNANKTVNNIDTQIVRS